MAFCLTAMPTRSILLIAIFHLTRQGAVPYDEIVSLTNLSNFMPLDQNAINELKEIYLKEFGEKLSDQEAWEMGISLVNIFRAVGNYCCKLKVEDRDNLTERGREL